MEYFIALFSSTITFKKQPTTISSNYLFFTNSNYLLFKKELHFTCCAELELNILTWSTKIVKSIRRCNISECKTQPPRHPKNTFPEAFHVKLRFSHLISNWLNGDNINSLMQIAAL